MREAHARVGRHFKAAQFEQAVAARGAVGREELVDAEFGPVRVAGDIGEDVAEDAVDEPRRDVAEIGHLAEGELQFVEGVVARLVDAGHLAGRAEEDAGEEVGERRVVLPVADQAAQEVGAAQERAVGDGRAAEHDVVAAAGADMPSVEQEFFRAEVAVARFLVEDFGVADQFRPVVGGLEIDFDDARIGRDLEMLDAGVVAAGCSLRCARAGPARRRCLPRRRRGRGNLPPGRWAA